MAGGINANGRVASALSFARAQIGKPYGWATAGPNTYDCSGLVWRAYEHAGYKFRGRPTTWTLVGMGTAVSKADIQPGDLVFPDAGHVQIYSGGGKIIEAPHTGAFVREVPEWGPYRQIRRLIANNLADGQTVNGSDPSVAPINGAQSDAELASINALTANLAKPETWTRTLMIILGVLVIMIGAGRMAAGDITSTITKVAG